jgi:hypothetical protein
MKIRSYLFWLVLPLCLVTVLSCGKVDKISAIKKGHFNDAPNITVEELINRYKFIDTASISWELLTDANKNEYVRVTGRFDKLDILLGQLYEKINTGEMDVSMVIGTLDSFFYECLVSDEVAMTGADVITLKTSYFEPDYFSGDGFFNCGGGALSIDFLVKDDSGFEIDEAFITFNMTSPVDDAEVAYTFVVPVNNATISDLLLNNTDIGLGF